MKTKIQALAAFAIAALLAFGAAAAERWNTLPPLPRCRKPAQSGFAPVNGIEMYYAVFGEGDPILLIHGGLANSDYWANEVECAFEDAQGHRRRQPRAMAALRATAAPMGYDLMASDYLALLDYLKIEKTAIVGWSDGGIIGIDIAMSHPERADEAVRERRQCHHGRRASPTWRRRPLSPPSSREAPGAPAARALAARNQSLPLLDRQHVGHAAELDEGAACANPRAHGDRARRPRRGDRARAYRLYGARAIPGAKLIILKDVGHFALLQDPDAYTKAILDFLRDP